MRVFIASPSNFAQGRTLPYGAQQKTTVLGLLVTSRDFVEAASRYFRASFSAIARMLKGHAADELHRHALRDLQWFWSDWYA